MPPIYIPHDDSILQALLALGQAASQGRRVATEEKRFKEEKKFRGEQADLAQQNLEVSRRAGAIARLTSMNPDAATQFALAPENERSLREELGDADFEALRTRLTGQAGPNASMAPRSAAPPQDFSPAGGQALDLSTGPKPFRAETGEETRVRKSQEQAAETGRVALESAKFRNVQEKGAFYAQTLAVGPDGKLGKWTPELRKQFEADTGSVEITPKGALLQKAQDIAQLPGMDQDKAIEQVKWEALELPKREAALRELGVEINLSQLRESMASGAMSRKYQQFLIDSKKAEDDEKSRLEKLPAFATMKPEEQRQLRKAADEHVSNAINAFVGAKVNGKPIDTFLSAGDRLALLQPYSRGGMARLNELGVSGDPSSPQHINATIAAIEAKYSTEKKPFKFDDVELAGQVKNGISTPGTKLSRNMLNDLVVRHRNSDGSAAQQQITQYELAVKGQGTISPQPGGMNPQAPPTSPVIDEGMAFIDAMNRSAAELEAKFQALSGKTPPPVPSVAGGQ